MKSNRSHEGTIMSIESDRLLSQLALALNLVDESGHPNCSALSMMLRDLPALRWNSKVFGSELADKYYGNVRTSRKARRNDPFELMWRATKFADFEQAWFIDACNRLKMAPLLHRKVWENAAVLTALQASGNLAHGKKGIGFGCGEESFPSYFASQGVEVLATDLDTNNQQARGWIETGQHGSLDKLYKPGLVDKPVFERLVTFQYADMNNIAPHLFERFDFCWSVCAFEHLGSIEAGLRFVETSAKLLKPGGMAVHTTEFSYANNTETIDNWGTVLFRRRDFDALAEKLRTAGYLVPQISFDVGTSPVDGFIDCPPYPGHKDFYAEHFDSLHLKLMVDGFPCTCFLVIVQRPV
jgi:2-polyprenyl-3-methyl-5-hydroxy-6-metoxy-1,4-benzoquinol methylase